MKNNKLHIISFDIPYPADYGGAIDVFYKIKALAEAGAEIYLHCFAYGRKESKELKALCKEVWYYPRKTGIGGISFTIPYIVYSRRNKALLRRLIEIEAPILFEGIHTTYYLSRPELSQREKAIRIHNIEHAYYNELAARTQDKSKRLYYAAEGRLLKKYEERLQAATAFFALSMADVDFYRKRYPNATHEFIGPFHAYNHITAMPGKGKFCLYHGNLSHPENIEAVLFLLREVFPYISAPVVIAGREPSAEIFAACKALPHCRLITNPSAHEMETLIGEAHIHVLPTFQPTGMKLKLLYALSGGRHVLVNDAMLHGTGLEDCCIIANSPEDFCRLIEQSFGRAFTAADIELRRSLLTRHYSNALNAQNLLTHLQR